MQIRLLILLLSVHIIVKGQSCDGYFPMNKGAIMEISSFNDKDKLQSVVTLTIMDVRKSLDSTILYMHSDITDEKRKPVSSGGYEAKCSNGNFSIGIESMLSGDQLKSMKDMTVKMNAEDILYPINASPGQTLKDAHLTIDLSMNGMPMPGTKIDITNRKVVSTESITTTAGTFDCIKVTSDVKFKSIFGYEAQMTEWLSKGNGMIRSETFKNGKMKSYAVLTKLQK